MFEVTFLTGVTTEVVTTYIKLTLSRSKFLAASSTSFASPFVSQDCQEDLFPLFMSQLPEPVPNPVHYSLQWSALVNDSHTIDLSLPRFGINAKGKEHSA